MPFKDKVMNHQKKLFSESMKMSDLVSANPKLLLILPRFGIELGFGDHSVKEVCEKSNVTPSFFLIICNVYTNESFTPSSEDIKSVDANVLITYLLASHRYYLDERLPHIETHLNRIIEACIPKYGHTLKRFFEEYKNEVVKHFDYEEETVFPYIRSLTTEKIEYKIAQFKENHTNIEDKLSDLMNILIKYLPAEVFPKERIEISLDITQLSSDLISHTLIEDRVMVPYVESLENALL